MTEILAGLGFEVIALDPSASMLDTARERLGRFAKHHAVPEPLAVEYRAEPLEECGVPSDTVDAALFNEALHHIVDEVAGLAQCFRVLRPGGALGVIGEDAWRPGSAEQEAFYNAEMEREGTLENPFTQTYLDEVLREAGFEDVTRYYSVNGFFPAGTGERPLAEAAWIRPETSNNLTAFKPRPDPRPTTGADAARTSCDIRVERASVDPGGRATVRLELRNTGETGWPARRPSGEGYVTVALHEGEFGRPDFREAGARGALPGYVAPGERVSCELTAPLPPGADPHGDWKVGLICEGLFWFAEREPVRFAD